MKTFSALFSKKLLLCALPWLGLSFGAMAQAPAVQWDKTFGGSGDDRLSMVCQTADGGYLLGGASISGLNGDKTQASLGNFDYWVVKVDATGTKVWDKTFGGGSEDRLTSMQQTADGGYILGGQSSSGASGSKTQGSQGGADFWIVKLDATGTKVWDKSFGGAGGERLASVVQTADGGYILGGQSDSGLSGDKTQAGPGSLDYWIVKTDATGTKVWDGTYGGASNDIMNALQPTADGGYILGGFSYSGVSGDKTQPTFGSSDYDYWVIKVNATGTKVWDGTFGGTGFDNLTSLRQTADGGYILGGFSNSGISGSKTQAPRGDYDNWIVKLSATGTKVWDKTFGGDSYDQLNSLEQTADGGFLLGSQSQSGITGDRTQANHGGAANTPDYWVVKTDATGTKQWDGTFGGTQDDVLTSLRQTADGGFILGGFSNSGISGSKTQAGRGSFDYWVVKLGRAMLGTRNAAAEAALELYPNPAHGTFAVQLPAQAPRTGLKLRLLDATGRVVWQQTLAATAEGRLPVTVGAQPAGLYILRVEGTNGYVQTQRIGLE